MNKRKRRLLEDVYASIPDAGCKGLCVEACGPINCSSLERKRLLKKTGRDVEAWMAVALDAKGDWKPKACVLLRDGRCAAYDERPTICRLFGAVDAELMKCPHGCSPAIPLSRQRSYEILDEVARISGDRT